MTGSIANGSNSGTPRILVINPNSSKSITDGLSASLDSVCPASLSITYYTAPIHAAKAITDYRTMVTTSAHCYEDLLEKGMLEEYDAFLVCCFSDHPLQHMIREALGPTSNKPCMGIFEAAVNECLVTSRKFGVVCTGTGGKPLLHKGISAYLGGNASDRWAGCKTSGLGVLELREGDMKHVEERIKDTARIVAGQGAEAIIMGCAGFAGMEQWMLEGTRQAGNGDVRIVDASKAGLRAMAGHLLVGIH